MCPRIFTYSLFLVCRNIKRPETVITGGTTVCFSTLGSNKTSQTAMVLHYDIIPAFLILYACSQ
uniref:Uncharacterized protein n=1 Tax=Sus scrofa TaxID=9823 RepID=A0A4X1UQ95_PIG